MVEEKVLDFYRKGRIFEANAFHSISEEIVIEKLPVVGCCDDHKVPLMANVIHDYLLLRFKCIAKTRNIQICDAKKTDSQTDEAIQTKQHSLCFQRKSSRGSCIISYT